MNHEKAIEQIADTIQKGVPIDEYMIKDVLDYPDVLRTALANLRTPLNISTQQYLMETAAFHSPIESFDVMLESGWKLPQLLCHQAGRAGRVELLEYAFMKGCLLDTTVPYALGNFEANIVQFVISGGVAPIKKLMECLEYAIQNNCVLRKEFYDEAFENGNMELIQYLKHYFGYSCGERGYLCHKDGCERCYIDDGLEEWGAHDDE